MRSCCVYTRRQMIAPISSAFMKMTGRAWRYEKGRYSRTGLRYERSGEWHSVSVLPAEGEYDGQPEKRSYRLELGTEKPCDVTVDGRKARIGFDDVKNIYTVDIPATPVRKSITVRYRYA